MKFDFIVVGSGLAGLTAAYKLQKEYGLDKKVLLIEKESFVGGRTSSFNDNGMEVEAGFHRHIGYYKELPKLLREVGVNLNDIIMWEKEIEIKLDKDKKIVLGIDPIRHPISFIKDIMGNREFLSFKDKLSMLKLFIIGFCDYKIRPKELDRYSIYEYAKKLDIRDNVILYIVTILSSGIFFLDKGEYSAKVFFGLFYPSLFRIFSLRVGAYKGGMSKLEANPIVRKFRELGGVLYTDCCVKSLILDGKKVIGVRCSDKDIYASCVVLASDLGNTKKILRGVEECRNVLDMPVMSAISVQIELSKRFMDIDRATFTLGVISSFTEEGHSTFKNSKGRISLILKDPDKYINFSDEKILDIVCYDFKKIGIDIKDYILDYRVIRHKDKFLSLGKGNDIKKVGNRTNIEGLYLAGDYIRNKMYSTMEGAVISGEEAFKLISLKY